MTQSLNLNLVHWIEFLFEICLLKTQPFSIINTCIQFSLLRSCEQNLVANMYGLSYISWKMEFIFLILRLFPAFSMKLNL